MCYLQLGLIVGRSEHPQPLHFCPLVNPKELAQLLGSQEDVKMVGADLRFYQNMIEPAGNLSMEAIVG